MAVDAALLIRGNAFTAVCWLQPGALSQLYACFSPARFHILALYFDKVNTVLKRRGRFKKLDKLDPAGIRSPRLNAPFAPDEVVTVLLNEPSSSISSRSRHISRVTVKRIATFAANKRTFAENSPKIRS